MIPKKIHYCWFGGNPLPELAQKCIASWKKYCPDYEIVEWNETNFDINYCDYVREAYTAKKWAFVSDVARLYVLVNYGGIYMDTDGLIVSGTENTQNTWMDAKYAGIAVTPRNGKAVEINALWYNALKIMAELSNDNKEKAKEYENLALRCKSAFEIKFYNRKRKCLYDVLGDSKIRPNQLFALSLTYPVLDPNSPVAKEMFETVTKKLLNSYGLKTLAKGEENYVEVYEGDGFRRDFSYHQGITWTWLLGLYYNSLKKLATNTKNKAERTQYENRLKEFVQDVTKTFSKEINERGCVGSIAEIYDSKKPYLPKGAIAQAWSVAEVFRIIMEK